MEFYIFAPAETASGGAELAHQLCATINKLTDYKAFMCYVNTQERNYEKSFPMNVDCPAPYEEYHTVHALNKEEVDRKENVVVIPEGLTYSFLGIHNARKVLWWMSVDNYLVSTGGENLKELERTVELHLVQSYYAKSYLEEKMKQPKLLFLTDYINLQHGQFLLPAMYRKNIVLYNPKKGYECTQELIKRITWMQWIPIINLNTEQTIVLMQSAKVYVDFGNHPGKDRIPREAAVNGCCILTNKRGSAAFAEDVPIMEQYKCENPLESVEQIDELLKDICENYSVHMKNFEDYRKWIKVEKARFDEEALEFVRYIEEVK